MSRLHLLVTTGLALLVVRSERGRPGTIRITARSRGLKSAKTVLTTTSAPVRRER